MKFTNFNDEYRNKCVMLINKELNNEKMARRIEKSIYNAVIDYSIENNIDRSWDNQYFKGIYKTKIISIYSNIKSDSYIKNIKFKERILSGEIDCKKISELSNHDIFPESWKVYIDRKIKIDKLKYELKPEAMTDMFKCRKCYGRNCSYYELQTRSADEPMTQFITCLDCNTHWKQ